MPETKQTVEPKTTEPKADAPKTAAASPKLVDGKQVFVYSTGSSRAMRFLVATDRDVASKILASAYPVLAPKLIGVAKVMPRDGDIVLHEVPVTETTDKCCAKDVAEAKRRDGVNYEFRGFKRVK